MTTPLRGRRALVTGGSRGIGAEIVRRLAADGAAVAFTYGKSGAEAEKVVADVEDGGTAVAIQADSGDPEQVAGAVDETVAKLGGLDILVNNAGVAYLGDIETFPMAEFDRLVAINVSAYSPPFSGRFHISARTAESSTSAASTPTGCPAPAYRSTR